MILNIPERVVLFGLLQQKGNIVTMKLVSELRNNLLFSEDEIREAGIKINEENGTVTWVKNIERDIYIPDIIKEDIKKKLKEMSEQGEITLDMVSICDKFEVQDA